jgi:hypothetical protein
VSPLARRVLLVLFIASLGLNTWLIARRQAEAVRRREAAEAMRSAGGGTASGGEGVEHVAGERRDLLDSVERDWLRRAGFTAPAESLRADLVRHPELIPTEGEVGGSMAFRPDAIYLLPGGHVWAIADDGHVETALLLRYDVKRDTTVQWTVVYSKSEP